MSERATDLKLVEEIFLEAVDVAVGDRDDFLTDRCGDSHQLRRQIEGMLAADARPDEFLGLPEPRMTTDRDEFQEDRLEDIGRYKLLQEIGEGGFGVVYMAEQREPVRRKVALKIIKPGMDSRAVVARFEAERQALALMDHPNIARVLDGGTTEAGTPFFVMDLVKGLPITEYCNSRKLTTFRRLKLFIAVCHAIQHAHQKGIIHRDIKPSNVMVTLHTDRPVPKVIDFGIAKALYQELTEKTLFTNYGAMVGTPQYMSPEQASMSGLDVDTRSDVYSLGILLYELLAGQPPFNKKSLAEAGLEGMRRVICEQDPPKPSALVSTLAGDTVAEVSEQRQVDSAGLKRLLNGDLDWIVMKAIDKDRARRYDTVAELADDVVNYLDGEQVRATPPSLGYSVRKFVGKHQGMFAAAAAVLLMLFVGTGIATFAWADAARANQQLVEANKQLVNTETQLLDQLADNIVAATAPQLSPAVESLRPLQHKAKNRLRQIENARYLTVAQRVNTNIALGELNSGERVGDYLLQNISTMEGDFCASLIRVLRKTEYDRFQLLAFAHEAEKKQDLKSKSRVAILGLYLGQLAIAEDMFRCGVDPIQRTAILSEFPNWHGDLTELVTLVDSNRSPDFRSGIIQLLGSVAPESIDPAVKSRWVNTIKSWYRSAPDLLTRNSAEWVLKRWNEKVPQATPSEPSNHRDWFVTHMGLTMRRVEPGQFTIGSWTSQFNMEPWNAYHDATPHQVTISRPFYIADREVTGRLFAKWAKEEKFPLPNMVKVDLDAPTIPTLMWQNAVSFCNWLSRRENLEECYYIDPNQRGQGVTNGWVLRRNADGYRLPTEAEWEYACRAKTITDYSWGQSRNHSTWFVSPAHSRSATTLPNPYGLFDMHGNLLEPCEDTFGMYPLELGLLNPINETASRETMVTFDSLVERESADVVVRGRHIRSSTFKSSSRDRVGIWDAIWPDDIGLRVARNAPDGSLPQTDLAGRVAELSRSMRLNAPADRSAHLAERGLCRILQGRPKDAADDFMNLLELMDRREDWGGLRTQFLTLLANEPDAIEELSSRRPDDTHLQLCRARHAALTRDWQAAADFVEPILHKRDPRHTRWQVANTDQEWHEMALYLLHAGRLETYTRFRSWMIREVSATPDDERIAWTVLKASTLAPIHDPDEQAIIMEIPRTVDVDWGGAKKFPPYGFALFRTGRLKEMLELWHEQGRDKNPQRRIPYFIAMAKWQLGDQDGARAVLAGAEQTFDQRSGQIAHGWPGIFSWTDAYLSRNVFLREANELILSHEGEVD